MLRKLLIANRGEIACRIMRTARRLGVATVAVHSDADAGARHVREADERVRIGPPPSAESYLRGDRIIAAARATGADAVHPGYGFLSESADFAEACVAAGLKFVGPTAEAMRLIGDKTAGKALAEREGVPVVPGTRGPVADDAALARAAGRIGFPVMIKAAAGGGGRGMRLVSSAKDLGPALDSARREAMAAFGDDRVLIERAIECPRHIEVQIFADAHGNVVHLFERECSLQRRHQKVIEESPAPGMSEGLRERLTDAAVRLARAAGYRGAGTVEFLVEGGRLDAAAPFYFIEANTRLQVEHPVTEAITSLDLVEWQLRVASGEPLPLAQSEIAKAGHAVEARICAEDPERGFLPATGRVVALRLPADNGVRIESGIEAGEVISQHYDSLLVKAIAAAGDRSTALERLARWLEAASIHGVRTNMGLLHALLGHRAVTAGAMDTGLVERELPALAPSLPADRHRAVARGVPLLLAASVSRPAAGGGAASPWAAADAFQLGAERTIQRSVLVDGAPLAVRLDWRAGRLRVGWPGVEDGVLGFADDLPAVYDQAEGRVLVLDRWRETELRWPSYSAQAADSGGQPGVRAPITGRMARIDVAVGDEVRRGDVVAVVEAMKMEHAMLAPHAGRVVRLAVATGAQVAAGTLIAEIEEERGAS